MKYNKLLIAAALLVVGWACSNNASTESSKPSKKVAAKAEKPDGQKIYKTYCVTCHGIAGDMGASGAHDLSKSELSVDERIAVITNGRNTMNAFKQLLKEDQIAAVAAYTIELKR